MDDETKTWFQEQLDDALGRPIREMQRQLEAQKRALQEAAQAALEGPRKPKPTPHPEAARTLPPPEAPLGWTIYDLRNKAKLTRPKLAKEVGLQPTAIYRHEKGLAQPSKDSIRDYARVFTKELHRDILPSDYQPIPRAEKAGRDVQKTSRDAKKTSRRQFKRLAG